MTENLSHDSDTNGVAEGEPCDKQPDKGAGQRAAPVVVSEGLAAGGGVWFRTVDPGVPLGPGLLATCVVFHGPHSNCQNERSSDNREPSKAAFPILTVPHAALHVSLVILISSCLGDQRQDAVGDVESNDL